MKIVVLDGYLVNPGDLSWDAVQTLGTFTAFGGTTDEEFFERARDADALLLDNLPITAERIAALPALRYVGLFATGFDRVDVRAAKRAGIAVTNVPEYSTPSVAQMTIALLLHLTNHVARYNQAVHQGGWRRGKEFRYLDVPLVELAGKEIAIFGLGTIGKAVGVIVHALGMRVLGWDKRRKTGLPFPVEWVSRKELFARADIVTLHVPLNDDTKHTINRETLAVMKNDALIINTSRGGLVDDDALAHALDSGAIGGAGLDGLGIDEPPNADNPLLTARNCVITPHVAWSTRASRERCIREVAENLAAFLNDEKRNRVV